MWMVVRKPQWMTTIAPMAKGIRISIHRGEVSPFGLEAKLARNSVVSAKRRIR